jgi:acylphosphatase
MNQRLRIIAQGYVQGVGFRATVRDLARGLGVSGWVKNCADGKVEMELEGEPALLQQLQQDLSRYFREYIAGLEVTKINTLGASGFQILF